MNEMLVASAGRSRLIVCPLPVASSGCPGATFGSVKCSAVPGTACDCPCTTPASDSAVREYPKPTPSQSAASAPSSPMHTLSNAAVKPVFDANETSTATVTRSEEHTSEFQSRGQLVCRLL